MAGPYDLTIGSGVAGLSASTATDRYSSGWTDRIFSPDTSKSSWWSRLRGMKWVDAPLNAPEFNWDEQTLPPMTDTNQGTPTAAADQVMTVNNITRWVGNSIVKNKRTGEFIKVDQVTTTAAPVGTVRLHVRAVGTTPAAAAVLAGDTWEIGPTARAENSRAIESRTFGRTVFYNYTQMYSQTLEMSISMKELENRQGKAFKEWDNQRKILENVFRRQLTSAFFDNPRGKDITTDSGNVTRTTGGFRQFATNSNLNYNLNGQPLTPSLLEDYVINFAAASECDQIEMVMRPQLYGRASMLYKNLLTINDAMPKVLQLSTFSFRIAGTLVTLHKERVLDSKDDNHIYVMNASNDFDDTLKLYRNPFKGGKRVTNGMPDFLMDQEENDSTMVKAQYASHYGPCWVGAQSGGIGMIQNAGF